MIETIKSNFEQIKEYKEQKTQLSNAVFKFAEFMMSNNLKKGGNLDQFVDHKDSESSTIIDAILKKQNLKGSNSYISHSPIMKKFKDADQ